MVMKVGLSYGRRYRVLRSASTIVTQSNIRLEKSYKYVREEDNYPIFRVLVKLTHSSSSGNINGTLEDQIDGIGPSSITYNTSLTTFQQTTSNRIRLSFDIPAGGALVMSYMGSIINKNVFGNGINNRTVSTTFSRNASGVSIRLSNDSACVYRENESKINWVPEYWQLVLLLIVGILIGYFFLIIIGILYIKMVNRDVNPFEYDNVNNPEDRMTMLETQDRLLMDEAGTQGDFNTIKNLSNVSNSDSIVQTLINTNRHQVYRDLDSLDILNSIYVDQGLEEDYEQLSVDGVVILVNNLAVHGTLKPEVMNKAVQKFQKSVQYLDKEIQTQHKKEANKIMKELSKKNRREMQQLLIKQRKQKETLESDLDGEDEKTQSEITELQKKQHETEREDLVHRLKLQQDEESEKLRKRMSLQKRGMLKELERGLIDDIIEKNPLNPSQADWLLNEHRRIQSHLDQRYDTELAHQRMLLEERLERRRALAKKKELEEENQTEMLNTLASQQVIIIRRLQRQEDITPEQAEEYLAKIKEDMFRAKEALDREKDIQEKILREKLNGRKRQQLEVKSVNQKVQNSQYMKQLKESSTQMDPTAYIDAVMNLHSQQRREMDAAENSIDEEDTKDLIEQYQYSVAQTEANIRLTKDHILQQLRHDGVTEEELSSICERHNRELRELQESHDEERQVQEQNLKARLLAKRKEMESNLDQEKQVQDELRRHENAMVQNLLLNQVSISDEERKRILQEHERNMVQVENSLTLSKLRQKRMLEEALAERKAKQMEKLQKKQETEANKKLRYMEDSDDEEDERSHKDLVEMMKRHGEQKLELLRGEEIDMDDEVENVRTRMMEERANALKEQEERIAAMLSSLQMEKAKELSRIEEQQKAINNLKMNLMDDLNERGVLSDDKCQQIISRHQEEQERLVQRLDNQRDEQEQMLRDRLRKRMEQREKQMNSEQKRKLEESVEQLPAKQRVQAQIRKALVLNRQMLEMEQFKTRMTKECNQTLEEAKRQFDVKKEKYLQDQELNFIAGLVQLGKFSKTELLAVLKILFPLKNSSEIEAILTKIHSGKDEKQLDGKQLRAVEQETDPLAQSTLVDRTKVSFHGIGTISRFKLKSPKKKQTRGNLMTLNMGDEDSGLTPIDRPDPLGRDSPAVIPDAPSGRGGDLPPLEPTEGRKKKKKKKKKRHTTEVDGDEDMGDTYIQVRA